MGQRQTYRSQEAVHALHQPHHAARQPPRYGNRLTNAYWGRAHPVPPSQYQASKAGGEKARLRREQKIDQLEREVVEIRQIIEEAMGDLAKLKDHVDHQLDVRAPFAFLFNQVTQNDPLVAEQDWEAEEWESESDGEEPATHDHSNYLIQETMWETPAPPP